MLCLACVLCLHGALSEPAATPTDLDPSGEEESTDPTEPVATQTDLHPADGITASGTCGVHLSWVLTDEGILTISGNSDMYGFTDENDDSVWRRFRQDIKRIVIEDGVTGIGDFAFSNCTNVVSVSLPSTLTRIGKLAFLSCEKLTDLSIPDSVTSIGMGAFHSCEALEYVDIPDGVTSIESETFYFCFALTNIQIPDSVRQIGRSAFYRCTGLTEITIPDNVYAIGNSAFQECSALQSIHLPSRLDRLGDFAFYECSNLDNVEIPGEVYSIGQSAFAKCSSLHSLVIPKSVSRIYADFFKDCKSMETIYFMHGVSESVSFVEGSGAPNADDISTVLFYCYEGSAPAGWVINNGYNVHYMACPIITVDKTNAAVETAVEYTVSSTETITMRLKVFENEYATGTMKTIRPNETGITGTTMQGWWRIDVEGSYRFQTEILLGNGNWVEAGDSFMVWSYSREVIEAPEIRLDSPFILAGEPFTIYFDALANVTSYQVDVCRLPTYSQIDSVIVDSGDSDGIAVQFPHKANVSFEAGASYQICVYPLISGDYNIHESYAKVVCLSTTEPSIGLSYLGKYNRASTTVNLPLFDTAGFSFQISGTEINHVEEVRISVQNLSYQEIVGTQGTWDENGFGLVQSVWTPEDTTYTYGSVVATVSVDGQWYTSNRIYISTITDVEFPGDLTYTVLSGPEIAQDGKFVALVDHLADASYYGAYLEDGDHQRIVSSEKIWPDEGETTRIALPLNADCLIGETYTALVYAVRYGAPRKEATVTSTFTVTEVGISSIAPFRMQLPADLQEIQDEAFAGVDLRVVILDGANGQTDLSFLNDYGTRFVVTDAQITVPDNATFQVISLAEYEAMTKQNSHD